MTPTSVAAALAAAVAETAAVAWAVKRWYAVPRQPCRRADDNGHAGEVERSLRRLREEREGR
jgi:hypothetical protein